MGRLLLALALVGCAPHAATAPAWPKQTTSADDGGESLAPHEAHGPAAAVERSDDDDAKPAAAVIPTPTLEPLASEPAVAPAAAQPAPTEDTITTEDIVIEVDD